MLTRMITLRSIRSRPLRTLLSAFGIVLGVAGILSIGITNRLALDSVTRLFKDTSGNSSLVITSATNDNRGFRDKILREIDHTPGLKAAVPSVHANTVLADDAPAGTLDLNMFGAGAGGGLLLYGIDPVLDVQVRPYTLAEGRFLSDDKNAYEVVLTSTFAEEKKIVLGNKMSIVTPNGPMRLRVVGLIKKEGPGQLNNGAFGVIPLRTAQELFNRSSSIDQVDIVTEGAQNTSAALEILKANLQATLGEEYAVVFPASQGKRMTQMLSSYQIGLNFLSGMALFVGAFLIYNAFSMTVVERTREFGMLRTVGMTRRQVMGQVLAEALVLGIIGSGLGVALGIFLAGGLSRMMSGLVGATLGEMAIPTDVLGTGIAVGVVVTLLAALMPALQAGRVSPLEALRVRGNRREGWLIRWGWIIGAPLLVASAVVLVRNPFSYDVQFRIGSLVVMMLFLGGTLMIPSSVSLWERISRPVIRVLYGNSGRIGSGNVRRARQRTTLTVGALMVGVAMILVVRGMTESFKVDLEDWMNAFIGGDMFVSSSVNMRQDVWRSLELVEGVAAASPIRFVEIKWLRPDGTDEAVMFMGVDPEAYSRVTRFVFADKSTDEQAAMARLAKGGAVFLSSVLSEKYHLSVGDTVAIKTRAGVQHFEVAAIVVDFYNQGMVIDGSWNDMRRFFKINDISALMLKVESGQNVDTVKQRILDQYGKRDHLTVESNVTLKGRVQGLMRSAFIMFDVLAYIAVIVASLGVVNTLMMNVMERTQEIGMLRGVGMTRWQVVQMVLAEAGLMGIIGGVIGLVFGVILSRIFLVAMMAMSGYNISYRMPLQAVVTALLVALVISQLAALLPARRAARIRILDAIHYE
jgi:putative ABC transport system permease protein